MVKISEKLNIIKTSKDNIKTAIETDGVEVGNAGIQEYADKINIMNTNIANAYTAIEEKGILFTGSKNSENLASTISAIKTGGTSAAPAVEKGIIIEEHSEYGNPTKIKLVNLPTIPTYAFSTNSTSMKPYVGAYLKYVTIEGETTSIGNYAFSYNTSLLSVILPNTITSIGNYAFASCSALESLNIPSNLITLGDYALDGCSKISITSLPDTIETIGTRGLSSCKLLDLNKLPDSLTSMGNYAFMSSGLKTISLTKAYTTVGDYLFQKCNSLKTAYIGGAFGKLTKYFFESCTALTDVTLDEGITEIGERALYKCTALTELDIPSTVTKIGTYAFAYITCTNVICRAVTPPTAAANILYSSSITSNTGYIYVPDDSVDAYKAATNWSAYAARIKPLSELEG